MNRLRTLRIFLKDEANNYYRIFNIANPKDKKGEYYLKIMFPDIKNIRLLTGSNTDKGIFKQQKPLENGVQEFTYHYRSGVSHFKDAEGHIDQKKNLPTLIIYPALHLVRFIIRQLEPFKIKDSSKITEDDFVLPIKFDGRPRGFELAISKIAGGWNVINEVGKEPIQTFKIPLEDPNISFHIADGIWSREPAVEQGNNTLFEIFRYEDPTSSFEFKGIPS